MGGGGEQAITQSRYVAEKFLGENSVELETWAASRVRPWGRPSKGDYDFSSWMNKKNEALLKAGCLYEYARESRQLRGLLVLMNPKRKRESFEIMTRPRTGRTYNMPCSFEGLSEKRVRAVLGRALDLLAAFAEELADNRSFTDLLRTKEKEVKRSLGERPLRFPKLKGVELALPFIGDYEPPWPWQPWSHDLLDPEFKADSKRLPWRVPDRPGPENDGTEKIAIKIRWRGFRNSDIAEAMKRLAERERPQTEPESKQQEPKDTIRANLKALSVMRIWKRFPKARDLGKRIGEAAKYTDYASVRKEAIEYKKRRWEGRANTAISNAAQVRMHNARERAFRFFQDLFPGETPANLLKART